MVTPKYFAGTPSSAGRSPQLTGVPWRPRVRWAVARIGERELSGAGSASEEAQFVQKPNGFTNAVASVVCCSLQDFSLSNPARIDFVSRCELAFEFTDGLLKRRSLHWLGWPAEREQTVRCHCVDADSVGLIAGEQRDDRRAFCTGDLDRPINDRVARAGRITG
jgi:hypothetical protein